MSVGYPSATIFFWLVMNAVHLELTFSRWLGTFLADCKLPVPSGALLYGDHVTDEEVGELRRYLAEANPCQGPGDSRSFAAERFLCGGGWKRPHSGGAWGWSGVFGSIRKAFGSESIGCALLTGPACRYTFYCGTEPAMRFIK